MGVGHRAADTYGWGCSGLHRDDVHASVFPRANLYSHGYYPHYIRRMCVGGFGVQDCADLDAVRGTGTKGKWWWEESRIWAVFDRVGI